MMLNDVYGMEQATIKKEKWQTRRVEKCLAVLPTNYDRVTFQEDGDSFTAKVYLKGSLINVSTITPKYKVGEVVAIAQRYKELGYKGIVMEGGIPVPVTKAKGYKNKMFVLAELMHHHVLITQVRIQRLQDITKEDCLAEGIGVCAEPSTAIPTYHVQGLYAKGLEKERILDVFLSPFGAYAALIDRISGKGTWQSNPWVVAYTFKLLD